MFIGIWKIHGIVFVRPVSGNVLLRRQQYRIADDIDASTDIARNIVRGKLANSLIVMNRTIRDHDNKIDTLSVKGAASTIDRLIDRLDSARNIDEIRGIEGLSAAEYFAVFRSYFIRPNVWRFHIRRR
ncbi:hypothetical protein MASR2M48_23920 [Spirochaetota bacterium]